VLEDGLNRAEDVFNEIENRRKALTNAFGADFGEPGKDNDFF